MERASDEGALVERIAAMRSLDRFDLLDRVSEACGIPAAFVVETPDADVIARCGFSEHLLRTRGVVPQRSIASPTGYSLVTTSLRTIALQEFMGAGIRVFLGMPSEVSTAWKRAGRDGNSVLGGAVVEALTGLAQDAVAHGGEELFIGQPSPAHYEYIANDNQRFRGTISETLLPALLGSLREVPQISFRLRDSSIASVTASPLTVAGRSLVCLTWERSARSVNPPCGANTPRIAVLDDDDRFLTVLRRILSAKGYEVIECRTLEELSESLHASALIIADLHLPGLERGAAIALVRSLSGSIPLIALTSDNHPAAHTETVLGGVDAFLAKGEDPAILIAWIRNLLLRSSRGGT